MTNPSLEMRKYLNTLIVRFYLDVIKIKDGLITMREWLLRKPDGVETLNIGAAFFKLIEQSFNQRLLIELYKFLDSKKSLRDFLTKAKENANSIKPTRRNRETGEIEIISPVDYRMIVDNHLNRLSVHNDTISKIKGRRDKELTHIDRSFFNDPEKHYRIYRTPDEDILKLLETISEILREQGVYYGEGDMDLTTIYSTSNLDRVLTFVRAFNRAQKDKSLQEKGIYMSKYKWDDYKSDDGVS